MKKALKSGQSLFEVLVAVGVMALLVVGLINMTTVSIKNSTYSRNKTASTLRSQELAEWLRGQRDSTGWVTFRNRVNSANQTFCFDSLGWTKNRACNATEYIAGTIFVRQAAFTCYTGNTLVACNTAGVVDRIRAAITTTWTSGSTHQSTVTTELTAWR